MSWKRFPSNGLQRRVRIPMASSRRTCRNRVFLNEPVWENLNPPCLACRLHGLPLPQAGTSGDCCWQRHRANACLTPAHSSSTEPDTPPRRTRLSNESRWPPHPESSCSAPPFGPRGRSLAIRAKEGQTAWKQWLKSSASIVAYWWSTDPRTRRADTYGCNFRLLDHAEHHHAVGGHHHRVFPGIQLQVAVGPEISCTRGCRFQAQVRPLDGDLCGRAAAVK